MAGSRGFLLILYVCFYVLIYVDLGGRTSVGCRVVERESCKSILFRVFLRHPIKFGNLYKYNFIGVFCFRSDFGLGGFFYWASVILRGNILICKI